MYYIYILYLKYLCILFIISVYFIYRDILSTCIYIYVHMCTFISKYLEYNTIHIHIHTHLYIYIYIYDYIGLCTHIIYYILTQQPDDFH